MSSKVFCSLEVIRLACRNSAGCAYIHPIWKYSRNLLREYTSWWQAEEKPYETKSISESRKFVPHSLLFCQPNKYDISNPERLNRIATFVNYCTMNQFGKTIRNKREANGLLFKQLAAKLD